MSEITWFLRSGAQVNLAETLVNGRPMYRSKITPTGKDSAKVTVGVECYRCGGAGKSLRWVRTGSTCYDCGGDGERGNKSIKVYSEEKLSKLNATKQKKQEKAAAKRAELARIAEEKRLEDAKATLAQNKIEFPEAVKYLLSYKGDNEFLCALRDKLNTGHTFTERMANAVLKVKASINERKSWDDLIQGIEANKTIPEFARQTVSGYILNLKWKEHAFGSTLKMLVLDERGFKVWCSLPKSVNALVPVEDGIKNYDKLKKSYIRFSVRLDPDDEGNDPYFVFGTQPNKVEELTLWGGQKQLLDVSAKKKTKAECE